MKSTITTTTDTSRTITVELTEADLKSSVEQAYNHLRPRVKAAGFRPGKAPNHIVERELGSNVVQAEVIDEALSQSYPKVLVEHDLNPVAQPSVNVSTFVPFTELTYTLTVEVLPEIKLADYKKIKKAKPAVTIPAKDVDAALEDLRKRMASHVTVERAAKQGDEVLLDFSGKRDGALLAGAQGTDHKLVLGSGSFIPGFEDQVVGLKAGDEKTFPITFPADYHEKSLQSAEVEFTVTIKEVHEVVLPELGDAFAVEVAGLKTLAELRADLESRLKAEKEAEAMRSYENELIEEIVKKSKLSLPQGLVDQQVEQLRQDFGQQLASSGLDLDKWLGLTGKDLEAFNTELRPQAEARVSAGLVMGEIAKAENIEVTDADIEAELTQLKMAYPDPAMQAELAKPEFRADIRSHLMSSRTLAAIVNYATK